MSLVRLQRAKGPLVWLTKVLLTVFQIFVWKLEKMTENCRPFTQSIDNGNKWNVCHISYICWYLKTYIVSFVSIVNIRSVSLRHHSLYSGWLYCENNKIVLKKPLKSW